MARVFPALAILIALMALATCDDSFPPRPSPPAPPSAPPQRTLTGVKIEGPASVAPGAAASYRFIASFSDGTTEDLTSQSKWGSSNASVLAIQGPGAVRGANRGEAGLFATYDTGGRSPTSQVYVLVLEDGTFRVVGRVDESGGRLPGAQVEVVSGTGTGIKATTDSGGLYALYGLAGEVRLDATLEGFEKASRTITVAQNTTADITMRPSIPPTDLNGTWSMTLTASAACAPEFPQDGTRHYTAEISQTGTALKLDVKAAGLSSSRIDGFVLDRSLRLYLPSDSSYYSDDSYYFLVEQLAPSRFLAIAGTASGKRDGNSVTGTLAGEFAIYATGNSTTVRQRQVSCRRDDHGFRLARE
jgi:hypothetical protein